MVIISGTNSHDIDWIHKGIELANLGRYEEAIVCFDKALEIDDRDYVAWYHKSDALRYMGLEEDALQCFNKASKIDHEVNELYEKGKNLYNMGCNEEAIECFNKVLDNYNRHSSAWVFKGLTLRNMGRSYDAIKCFEKGIEIDDKYAYAWLMKGLTLQEMGHNQDAIVCLDKALEIVDNYAPAWYNKGIVLSSLGKNNEALECFNIAIAINPDYKDTVRNSTLAKTMKKNKIETQNVYKNKEDYKKINKILDEINRLLKSKEYVMALSLCDKIMEINSKDCNALIFNAFIFFALGRLYYALYSINKAIEIYPNEPTVLRMKARIIMELGRSEEAKEYLLKAAQLESVAPTPSLGVTLDKIELILDVKNPITMLTHHSWIWEVTNKSSTIVNSLLYFIEGDTPQSFEQLGLHVRENNVELEVENHLDLPYRKDIVAWLKEPIIPGQAGRCFTMEYDWENTDRHYQYDVPAHCNLLRYILLLSKEIQGNVKILKINKETGEKIPVETKLNITDLGSKREVTWTNASPEPSYAYRVEW